MMRPPQPARARPGPDGTAAMLAEVTDPADSEVGQGARGLSGLGSEIGRGQVTGRLRFKVLLVSAEVRTRSMRSARSGSLLTASGLTQRLHRESGFLQDAGLLSPGCRKPAPGNGPIIV